MLYKIKQAIKSILPPQLIESYHYTLVFLAALFYGFPSRKIKVFGVTGTKGKSSTIEYLNAILEKAGYKTAISSTIRFKIGERSVENKFKMTMPGRFFLQKFIKEAVLEKCDVVLIEMTSEGVKQFRHKFIELDALIFTNIAPEHIESHGSYENYKAAKLELGKLLEKSKKRPRIMVANADSELSDEFLKLNVEYTIPFSLSQAKPIKELPTGIMFNYEGKEIFLKQKGKISVYNALAAATLARAVGIDVDTIKIALEEVRLIPGRLQKIDEGQDFEVIVDYAHTPDSLKELYEAFKDKEKACVLGATGGGRDKWKRPKMASIAAENCKYVILTDEDPYDEDPMKIILDLKKGAPNAIVEIDRRKAIRKAISLALAGSVDAVLISGKGTDPYIMRANGSKEPWSDAEVAHQELRHLMGLEEVKSPNVNKFAS